MQDEQAQDSLIDNSFSSEDSCSEEIDDSDESNHSSSSHTQNVPSSPSLSTELDKSIGIVLQFAPTLSNKVNLKKESNVNQDHSLVQLNSSSDVHVCPSSVSLEAELNGVEVTAAQPSKKQANRSLSAVKRKQDTLVDGREITVMDEVLHALKKENESVTNLQANAKAQLSVEGDDSQIGISSTNDEVSGTSSLRSSPSDPEKRNRIESQSSYSENPPKLKGPLLPSLPFKPVLVNRYKSSVPAKPSVRRGEVVSEAFPVIDGSRTALRQEQCGLVSEVRGREQAELSLTNQPLRDREMTSKSSSSRPSSEVRSRDVTRQLLSSGVISDRGMANESIINRHSSGIKEREGTSKMPTSRKVRGAEATNHPLPSVETRGTDVGSHSLTENTVQIITDKVRQMDARYK